MRSLAARLPPLNVYVTGVILLGVACCAAVFAEGGDSLSRLLTPQVMLLAACAFAGELISVKIVRRGTEGEVTTSTAFAFAALLVAGPACAMVVLVSAGCIADLIRRKPATKLLFNASQYAITVTVTAVVLGAFTSVPHMGQPFHFTPDDLPGILVAAAVFFLVNFTLVAIVIALAQHIRVGRFVAQDLLFQLPTGGLMLGLAPIIALAADFALPAVALLFLPLLAVYHGGRQAIATKHQAAHDALTGLPNRSLFRYETARIVNVGRTAAVMLIDLDHFKEINDTLGHHAGDRLLQEVSERLRSSLGEQDMVARLGGDEFGVLLPDAAGGEEASRVAVPAADAAAPAVLDRGPHARGRRQHRHRLCARARRGGRAADPARRHRDVRRQGGSVRPHAVRAAARPLQPAPPEPHRGVALGDRRRRDRRALPAQGGAADRPHHRRRGARALAASRSWG